MVILSVQNHPKMWKGLGSSTTKTGTGCAEKGRTGDDPWNLLWSLWSLWPLKVVTRTLWASVVDLAPRWWVCRDDTVNPGAERRAGWWKNWTRADAVLTFFNARVEIRRCMEGSFFCILADLLLFQESNCSILGEINGL